MPILYKKLFCCAHQFKLVIGASIFFVSVAAQALKLEDAIDSAIKFDPSLRASKFNLLATEENIAIARARLLPQISLQGSSNQLTQTTTQELSSGGSSSRSFTGPSVNHQFVIRQALLRPKELSALRYAELQTQYMKIKYKSDLRDLRSRVINAWIELLGAQEIVKAYEVPLTLMQVVAKQERAKYEQGDSTKDSAAEAEAQYENSMATYIQAVENFKVKEGIFENLTKIPATALAEKKLLIDLLPTFSEGEKTLLWESFQDSSLELQMSKLNELMQLERVKIAESDHKPTLDFIAAVNLAQNDATSTQGIHYRNKQIGFQYTVPLFSGGSLTAGTTQAKLGYEASLAEGEALLTRLKNDFDISWGLLISNAARQKAMVVSLSSGLEQVRSTNRAFVLGVKSVGDSANSELALARKMNDLIFATQEYLKSVLKVDVNKLLLANI